MDPVVKRLVVVALLFGAGTSRADAVFDCAAPDGQQVLQNAPCPKGTLLWLKVGKSLTGAAATSSSTAPSPSPALTAARSEPRLGMTSQQVRALLGPPAEISQEEVVDGRTDVWTYPDAHVYEFDASGVLVSK